MKGSDRQMKAAKPRLREESLANDTDFVEHALSDGGGSYLINPKPLAGSWPLAGIA